MLVRILGPLDVSSDSGSLSLGGRKQRVVLACLALRIGRVVPVDELIDAGWGDDLPANPANALQYQVVQLRKIIESDASHPQYLITSKPGYRLDDAHVAAIELQLDIALADGRHAEVAPQLAQLTREHPLREELWARRVLALYRSGRQSEALRAFHDARESLAEVGLEPGTELRELEQQIINQDSSLLPKATPLGRHRTIFLPRPTG
ncbi:MAG: DNA-binding SARP family transcriptional activator [Ilumatobacter sp.]|jgi:DNA-binding SARP family transcriptional activator